MGFAEYKKVKIYKKIKSGIILIFLYNNIYNNFFI
jgi:hypothetical protein